MLDLLIISNKTYAETSESLQALKIRSERYINCHNSTKQHTLHNKEHNIIPDYTSYISTKAMHVISEHVNLPHILLIPPY
jgi:hypothetical protein